MTEEVIVETIEAADMDAISSAIGNIFTVVSTVADKVMQTPVTAMFFVAGIVGLGCGILSRLKHV